MSCVTDDGKDHNSSDQMSCVEKSESVDQSLINLKVTGQDGSTVYFRMRRSTQLGKLMKAFCDRLSVEVFSISFLFGARARGVHAFRLQKEQTPDELGMEDGDEIFALLRQTGD